MSDNEQTNKNRKTLADIVAMVRWAAQSYEGEAEKSEGLLRKSFELSAANYRIIADLVEAAWKRERAKVEADALSVGGIVEAARTAEKSSAVGNAAAMREALIKAKKAICHHAKHVCQSLSWENSDIQSNCADILCAHRELCEAKTAINSALSAPPRNCDMEYTDRVEMYSAFKDWCKAKGHTMEPMLAYDAFDWLLAPAKKEKGEGE